MPERRAIGSSAPGEVEPSDRLDSWKEIAAYLRRDVTTVQRWEKREAMPVHRHQHDRMGSVYAFRSELDAWARSRSLGEATTEVGVGPGPPVGTANADASAAVTEVEAASAGRPARRWRLVVLGALVLLGLAVWATRGRTARAEDVLAGATFRPLTDFEGTEQAAAISRDGRFVAFQSDREGEMDVWVTQVGTGRFTNLTRGTSLELVNPSVRTLGFSPDGSVVTFWGRARASAGTQPEISIWAVPLLGGQARPYLEGVAEYDWSDDGEWLAYHTPAPGDPMFVRGAAPGSEARKIFSAPAGLHSHFPVWSPDRQSLVFVQG